MSESTVPSSKYCVNSDLPEVLCQPSQIQTKVAQQLLVQTHLNVFAIPGP